MGIYGGVKMTQEIKTWAEVNAPISYRNYTGAVASGDHKRAKRIEKHIKRKHKEETK